MPDNTIDIKITDWLQDNDILKTIRYQVFVKEQKVPVEMEWDEYDSESIHFLAFQNNIPIACARLKPDGQIGRMAVLEKFRNQGIGSKLLAFVLKHANMHRIKPVYLHAQTTAIPFYERQGFSVQGKLFYEAGIPHREMKHNITNTTQ